MIMTIVDSGGKLPKGAAAAVFAMLAYVAAASIVAGLGDLGAGLLVLVMGAVTIGVVDYVMWRDLSREGGSDGVGTGARAGTGARFGSYVLAGPEGVGSPEMPAVVLPFHAVRTEAAHAAPPTASASPAQPASFAEAAPARDPAPAAPAESEPIGESASSSDAAAVAPGAASPAPAVAEAQADTVGTRPSALDAPRGTADDLKRINGIGPANERKLNALGIYHFDQMSGWDEAQVRWVGTYLAFPGRIERERWVAQARALAEMHAEPAPYRKAPA
ncbi:hypothetical protein ACTZWW_05625 [Salinarimonas sp. NSM]|uniref:hypothetical protein n=1 Tax=Salinarimonas sp. NSM TaxID=3458003 RepID=UPI004035E6D9